MFNWVWITQLFSLTGSALTSFGMGVWIYQKTGSVLDYSLLTAGIAAPALLVAPWAGAWVDRMDRRWVMMVADTGAALCTAVTGLLLWSGRLDVWQLLLLNAAGAVCQAFQRPAFIAAVTTLLPKGELGRASGLMQLTYAVPYLVAPLVTAFLLGAIGLAGIIALDLVCFALATSVLLIVRFPRLPRLGRSVGARSSALNEFAEALTYIRQRQSLSLLLGYYALLSFRIGVLMVLVTPIVLAVYSAWALGIILSFGGVGMLAGALAMSVWGGPRRRVFGILGFDMLLGAAVLVGGVWTSIPMLSACGFVLMLCEPIIAGCTQTLWQLKVSPALQGRVLALHQVIVNAAVAVAAIAAGLAAEHYFEPWMMPGGLLADTAGAWMGVGKGRGVGLMFVVIGALTIALACAGLLHPGLRRLEDKVPDAH